jgi:hypothetical protein
MRWVLLVLENSIGCDLSPYFLSKWTTCVQIAVIAGEIAAGHLYSQTMSSLKDLRRRPQVNLKPVNLPGYHKFWPFQ